MKKLIYALFLLILVSTIYAAECGKIPTDSCTITKNTVFTKGTYNLPNGISIRNDSVVLNCAGSTIHGIGKNNGLDVQYQKNLIVRNCVFSNYSIGFKASRVDYSKYKNLQFYNNNKGMEYFGYHNGFDKIKAQNNRVK